MPPLDPRVHIGHVHLTVSDLDRSLAFYRDVLGFEVTTRYGREAVFLSAGGYHHHIGLNTWAGRGAPRPPAGTTGLYHFAILYPDRRALAAAVRRVLEHGIPLEGPRTTASARRSMCAIRTAMAWSSTATVPKAHGRAHRTAGSSCIRGRWIWKTCSRLPVEIYRPFLLLTTESDGCCATTGVAGCFGPRVIRSGRLAST